MSTNLMQLSFLFQILGEGILSVQIHQIHRTIQFKQKPTQKVKELSFGTTPDGQVDVGFASSFFPQRGNRIEKPGYNRPL